MAETRVFFQKDARIVATVAPNLCFCNDTNDWRANVLLATQGGRKTTASRIGKKDGRLWNLPFPEGMELARFAAEDELALWGVPVGETDLGKCPRLQVRTHKRKKKRKGKRRTKEERWKKPAAVSLCAVRCDAIAPRGRFFTRAEEGEATAMGAGEKREEGEEQRAAEDVRDVAFLFRRRCQPETAFAVCRLSPSPPPAAHAALCVCVCLCARRPSRPCVWDRSRLVALKVFLSPFFLRSRPFVRH